jgi:hypothetical protein
VAAYYRHHPANYPRNWEVLLEKYRQIPQYEEVNKGMSLEEFKGIFWWEYFHRLLGRLIGLVYFIPFVYFVVRKRVDRVLGLKLFGIFVLGGLQGSNGVVHGYERIDRKYLCQSISIDCAFRTGIYHICSHVLGSNRLAISNKRQSVIKHPS